MVVCVVRGQLITRDGKNCSSLLLWFKTSMPIAFVFPCLPAPNHVRSYEECDVFVYIALWIARQSINADLYIPRYDDLLDCFFITGSPDADTQVSP